MIRHVLHLFRAGEIGAPEAASRLELSRSRLYSLYGDYLRASAGGSESSWLPGVSGGDHAKEWPDGVEDLLRKRLASDPPASYAFAASEVDRVFGFRLARSQVRRWAVRNGFARPVTDARQPASARRWQRSRVGELWQMDATPHRWFGADAGQMPMLNMLDDCSRFQVGGHIYAREVYPAYLHFLSRAFSDHGLPLELYVDYHSMFFSDTPQALTRLGEALMFYGVSFKYAPTPQAKGKIERVHQVWQDRLPAYFGSEGVRHLDIANEHLDALVYQRNHRESHREIGMTPADAWRAAEAEGRICLRPAPKCPWWPFVWSERAHVRVGPDRKVDLGVRKVRVETCPGTWLVKCSHTDGYTSLLAKAPSAEARPQILFSDRPK